MRILVTGGAGFIGSHIVEELLRRGEDVRLIDDFSTGKEENIESFKDRIEIIEGDIRSYHIVREAVEGMEVILHQAALPSVPHSVRDPITTNLQYKPFINLEEGLRLTIEAMRARI